MNVDHDIAAFGLVMARIMGLMFTAPVISSESVGYRGRIILTILVSVVIFPIVKNYLPDWPQSSIAAYGFELLAQGFIGALIGFMMQILFAAFQLAGEFFSIQMGLSFSEVLDPQSQVSIPLMGTVKNMIGILLFLAVDFEVDGIYVPAYLHMIRAITYSFIAVPTMIVNIQTTGGLFTYIDQSFGVMFLTALKIGLPLVGILFISSVALGILGRAAPQLNLMNMGIQINISVGLIVLFIIMPVIVPLMRDSFHIAFDNIGEMLKSWPSAEGAR